MSEKFRLLRRRVYHWLIGDDPILLFHGGTRECDGHTKRQLRKLKGKCE